MKLPKNGPVNVRLATAEELKNLKPHSRGRGVGSNYIKAKRQIGDTQPMFGEEYVAFKGGEGGRNWSISATLI